jgi:SAM-dependent MidA family methyltransferase
MAGEDGRAGPAGGCRELEARLRSAIVSDGELSFARFMELALYDPDHGYYTRAAARIGRAGDFVTSPTLSAAFGRTLAGLLPRLARAADERGRLRVVDAGAGEGTLLAALTAAAGPERVEPVLVERGAALRRRARERLAATSALALADTAALGRLGPAPGLVLANELFDALPARRLRRLGDRLEEACVTVAGGRLVEVWRPRPMEPGLDQLPHGRECCLALGVAELLADLAAAIGRGLVLVIDYGYPRPLLLDPQGPGNPMRGFRGGRLVDDLLASPGEVDLTAHVDFTKLAEAAAARRLIHPEDMGGAFRCLGLGKGLPEGALADLGVRDRRAQLRPAAAARRPGPARR